MTTVTNIKTLRGTRHHIGMIEWMCTGSVDGMSPMENPGFCTDEEMIDDVCDLDGSNLEFRHGELVKKMVIGSDAEVTDRITIWEIHPRVTTLEGQVQTLQTSLHGVWLQNQQLQTRLSDMEKREGTWIAYMSWMEKHLAVLEKKLTGPPTGPQ
ncbi:hypothetical protein Tco_0709221 [Tanacetum coccineum]